MNKLKSSITRSLTSGEEPLGPCFGEKIKNKINKPFTNNKAEKMGLR
jgi:hypothetical protein